MSLCYEAPAEDTIHRMYFADELIDELCVLCFIPRQ